MAVCYIGIGSNLGNRNANIEEAISRLRKMQGVKVDKVSRIYQTRPIGGPLQGKFLNGAIRLRTILKPFTLLKRLKKIEEDLGRRKTVKYGPRSVDLDILLYEDLVINKDKLRIPHPRMFGREFVLKPLSEII